MRKENQIYVRLSRLGLGPLTLFALHLYGPMTFAADQFHTPLPMHTGFQCYQCTPALSVSSVHPPLTDPSAVYITYIEYPMPVSQMKKWTYNLNISAVCDIINKSSRKLLYTISQHSALFKSVPSQCLMATL